MSQRKDERRGDGKRRQIVSLSSQAGGPSPRLRERHVGDALPMQQRLAHLAALQDVKESNTPAGRPVDEGDGVRRQADGG